MALGATGTTVVVEAVVGAVEEEGGEVAAGAVPLLWITRIKSP